MSTDDRGCMAEIREVLDGLDLAIRTFAKERQSPGSPSHAR